MPQSALAERLALPEIVPQGDDLAFPDQRSLGRGLSILAVHFALYFGTLAGALAPLPP